MTYPTNPADFFSLPPQATGPMADSVAVFAYLVLAPLPDLNPAAATLPAMVNVCVDTVVRASGHLLPIPTEQDIHDGEVLAELIYQNHLVDVANIPCSSTQGGECKGDHHVTLTDKGAAFLLAYAMNPPAPPPASDLDDKLNRLGDDFLRDFGNPDNG